jgi:heme-degrading monooxygenase HmoA
MTATINPSDQVMTLINVFTVEPGKQQQLIDLLDQATETAMKRQPGFISASIHKSADGRRVVNYAQWRSKADFEAMQKNPEAVEHMKGAAAIARFDPIVCEVASSHAA